MVPEKFTLERFRDTLTEMMRLGSIRNITKQIPGMGDLLERPEGADPDRDMRLLAGIIDGMTRDERQHPEKIDARRLERIAAGSGVRVSDVKRLLHDFSCMSHMMRKLTGM